MPRLAETSHARGLAARVVSSAACILTVGAIAGRAHARAGAVWPLAPVGCGRDAGCPATKAAPDLRCPPGAVTDQKRTQEIVTRLRTQEQGRRLLAGLGRDLLVCYGNAREGVLQTDGTVLLQGDRAPAANAARLGHLLAHLVDGMPLDETIARASKRSCDQLVARASELERSAQAIENQLRQGFGLPVLPREDLSAQYRQRCEALRRPPGPTK